MARSDRRDLLGYHIARFFTERLVSEQGVSGATVASYRDATKLLISYLCESLGRGPDLLVAGDLTRDSVAGFLRWLEESRGCSATTRNQRLAVVKSLCRWIMLERPESIHQLSEVIAIREKKAPMREMPWLSADEVRTLLASPDASTWIGARDRTMLSVLYDSAARVQELCNLSIGDVRFGDPAVVTLHGKGSKVRGVPLMDRTASLLEEWLARPRPSCGLPDAELPVFPSARGGGRLTRWGVSGALSKYVSRVRESDPSFGGGQRITPHALRHSKAVHLVQAGVNIVYIRDLLGHESVVTTEVYARVDSESKRLALEKAYRDLAPEPLPDWRDDDSLMGWLDSLGIIES